MDLLNGIFRKINRFQQYKSSSASYRLEFNNFDSPPYLHEPYLFLTYRRKRGKSLKVVLHFDYQVKRNCRMEDLKDKNEITLAGNQYQLLKSTK